MTPIIKIVREDDLPEPKLRKSFYMSIIRRLVPGRGVILDEDTDDDAKRNSSGLHAAARACGVRISTYKAENGKRVIKLLPRLGRPRKKGRR